MSEGQCALFIPEPPTVGAVAQCLGIVVPLDFGSRTGRVAPHGRMSGWVNGAPQWPLSWQPVREFDAGIPDPDEELKYGLAVGLFWLRGECGRLPTPCYVMPTCDSRPTVVEVVLVPRIRTCFETAGFQNHLWLGTVAEIVYRDFMGALDRDFVAAARERRFQSGDAILVTIREQPRLAGVAVLSSQTDGETWNATLHCPSSDLPDLAGATLVSKHVCEFDRVTAVFQTDFAVVRAVRSP